MSAPSIGSPSAVWIASHASIDSITPGGPEAMIVADTANNRVLVWDAVPSAGGVPADRVLGQPDFGTNGENRWDAVGADTFCWPYGLSVHGGRVAVTDSGNNRVTIWELA